MDGTGVECVGLHLGPSGTTDRLRHLGGSAPLGCLGQLPSGPSSSHNPERRPESAAKKVTSYVNCARHSS
jgi:hypothetical protein